MSVNQQIRSRRFENFDLMTIVTYNRSQDNISNMILENLLFYLKKEKDLLIIVSWTNNRHMVLF